MAVKVIISSEPTPGVICLLNLTDVDVALQLIDSVYLTSTRVLYPSTCRLILGTPCVLGQNQPARGS